MGGLTGQASAATVPSGGVSAMDTIVGGPRPSMADTTTDMILRPSGVQPVRDAPQVQSAKIPPAAVPKMSDAPAETGQGVIDKAQAGLRTIGGGDTSTPKTSALFEQRVKGTALAGQQPYIETLAQKHNVPPEVAKAIIALETGWGKNVKGNNPAGIMTGGKEAMNKVQFNSIEAGLERSLQVIAKNYHRAGGDIHVMNKYYAPPGAKNDPNNTNRFWARDVTSIASRLSPSFGASTITAGRY